MSATLLWCFLGLGALAYFGARRGKWSYEVANLCWWATVWIATENALIRWNLISLIPQTTWLDGTFIVGDTYVCCLLGP